MEIKKNASAKWQGSVKEGKGHISLESGAFTDQPYGFNTRFEDKKGTNPEELIAAAHASCFSMALSKIIGEAGFEPKNIETNSTVTLTKTDDGFKIPKVKLTVSIDAPEASAEKIKEMATQAKDGCPISKLLNADISLEVL
ncbi:MAG: OsmC family peroxiredoxin [Halobacteriovoraceae bacterium]|nr:OsmC family peroxiredoxin [Halobacteriovoraceae bacterium]|tara:strand:+ start:19099 stop:19521 length:423 start_codon:yes stop_codon:yes gene_type:complete